MCPRHSASTLFRNKSFLTYDAGYSYRQTSTFWETYMPYQVLKKEPDACAFRLRKFSIVATLSVALITEISGATFATTLAAPPINVNGSHVTIAGLERDNSVFVPVKGFFEKLGAKVTTSGSTLVAIREGKQLARMTIGSRSAEVNGATQMLPVAPFMSGGTAMLPLRSLSEAAGASVSYVAAPRAVNVTRSAGVGMTGAGTAGAAAAGAAAATVAQAASPAAQDAAPAAAPAATDVASAAPVADTQTNNSGIPWWVWALLALLILGLILWALTRRKKEPVITTTSRPRGNEPTITTTGKADGNEPTITTRK